MKLLKLWGWILFAASAGLFGYGWLSGAFNGHGIGRMDAGALALTVFSAVCLLLAVTVAIVLQALKEKNKIYGKASLLQVRLF